MPKQTARLFLSGGKPATLISLFLLSVMGWKTKNCVDHSSSRERLWKSFADNPMCLHGSYICLNRIPRKWRHQQNGNRTLRAVWSLKEACSNCAIHDWAPLFCWCGTMHRHSEDGNVCIKSWNWHPGVLDFLSYLISHQSDNILAPLLQFSRDVCSSWSDQVC